MRFTAVHLLHLGIKRDEDASTCVNLRPLALHTPTHTRASETRVQRVWRAQSVASPLIPLILIVGGLS